MNRRGFTVVELLVTITIIGILLTLAVVNLRGTQVNARNSERKSDVDNIARHLEVYYSSGSDTTSTPPNEYLSIDIIVSEEIVSEESILSFLRDINPSSLRAPNVELPALSLIAATSDSQTVPISGDSSRPTVNEYVYQPLQASGALCTNDTTQECRRFNLYYRLENDDTLQIIKSRNQ
jgi:prepilin-type N-terminal cleavage/methylation domain-containing protein